MRWLRKLLMRCQMLFHRDHAGEQLQDELQFHLDRQTAENVAAGMGPEELAVPHSAASATPPHCGIRPALPGAGNGSNCCSAIFDSLFAVSPAIPAFQSSRFWS